MSIPTNTKMETPRCVFIAGAKGYMGARLAQSVIHRGYLVSGLVRSGAENRQLVGCQSVSDIRVVDVPGTAALGQNT